ERSKLSALRCKVRLDGDPQLGAGCRHGRDFGGDLRPKGRFQPGENEQLAPLSCDDRGYARGWPRRQCAGNPEDLVLDVRAVASLPEQLVMPVRQKVRAGFGLPVLTVLV